MTSMFPLEPSVGDVYENYEWNGTAWKFIGYEKINDYAPKDSPAITGVASLPSQTTIGVVSKTEIEKLYGFSGQIASTQYVQEQINDTLANLTGGSVTIVQPTIDTPAGAIQMFGGLAAPFGYLLCDGSAVDRTAYAGLFTAISTTYGAGNGTTTFNLPNLKGRVVVGVDAAQTEFNVLGEVGGAKTHQHIATNSGNTDHVHTAPAPTVNTNGAGDHGHNIDGHSHYADHSHSVNPGSTSTTSDSHSHSTNGNTGNGVRASGNVTTAGPSHTHGVSTDSHSHTVNIATFTSATANGEGVNVRATALGTNGNPGNHTHGNTVGGITTNTGSGSHGHTIPASDSLSNLQPYITLNYIIKT